MVGVTPTPATNFINSQKMILEIPYYEKLVVNGLLMRMNQVHEVNGEVVEIALTRQHYMDLVCVNDRYISRELVSNEATGQSKGFYILGIPLRMDTPMSYVMAINCVKELPNIQCSEILVGRKLNDI